MAVFMTGIAGMQAAPLPYDGIDRACLLQLSVEDTPRNTSSVAEASAGAKPVEEIATEELGAMENIMGKELGAVESIIENVVGKELGVMEKSMGDIVDLKKTELGLVKRGQGHEAGPQAVEGPGPDDDSLYPLVPPPTSGAQEEARGATTRGTQVVEHILDHRVLGDTNRSDPQVLANSDSSDPSDWAAGAAVDTLDVAATDAAKGFYGGFTDGTYGYAIPYFNNNRGYHGTVARFDLATFGSPTALDLAANNPALRGFVGGFTDGTYGYAIPNENNDLNGNRFRHGTVARFVLATFSSPAALDLAAYNTALKGFEGGFTDGTYGYAIPYYNGAPSGTVGRFDLATFSFPAALDLAANNPALTAFSGGFTDGTYGYAIPHINAAWHGTVARFVLATFSSPAALDLAANNPALKGFVGGFTDGTYGYAIPYYNVGPSGTVARFDLATFRSPAALNLAANNPALKGFMGGFTDGTYGYAIPYDNGLPTQHGTVARFDLATFSSPAALDLAATDPALKGFRDGFTDGTYGYAIPYFNAVAYSGTVARFGVIKHELPGFGQGGQSGQDDQSSVVGDPHVVSVAHARFEIRAEGVHKLVQIPQLVQGSSKPDLRVDANIQHLVSNDCSKSFMTSLSIFGRWTEDAFGLIRISQGSDMPNTTLLINNLSPEEFFTQFPLPGVKAGHASVAFKIRDVSFHVGKHFEGRYGKQQAYLNVRITGLKKHNDLGGLLGYDDHADAEKLDVNCTAAKPAAVYQSSFIGMGRSAPIITDGGSRIEAE